MSNSFDFEIVDAFVPGTIGEPGNRVFYIQARLGTRVVTFRMEKEQVGMLGQYLGQLASAMGPVDPDRDVAGLIEPVEPEWIVGTLSVGVDEEAKVIVVTAEELVPDEDAEVEFGDDFTEDDLDQLLEAEEAESAGGEARFTLTLGQAAAFAETAEELIAAGRPPCRLCGRPIGPEGHACPRWN